jgi:predicted CDP-diglyceride synthetase/phosphatidate cytidylyltransferase
MGSSAKTQQRPQRMSFIRGFAGNVVMASIKRDSP